MTKKKPKPPNSITSLETTTTTLPKARTKVEQFWQLLADHLQQLDFKTGTLHDSTTDEICGVSWLNTNLTDDEIAVTLNENGSIRITLNLGVLRRTGNLPHGSTRLCADIEEVMRHIVNNYT